MKLTTILVLQVFFIINILSQTSNNIRFKHLTVQDGISRSWVKCILRDSIGYLWVGTADGLNKYDGVSFKTYKYSSTDSFSINHNDVLYIYEDKKKNIWIGTAEGLNLYDRKKDRFYSISGDLKNVRSIYEYDDGRFLIGSPGGLYLFNPKSFTSKQLRNDTHIGAMLHDKNNNFWLATYEGLFLLDTANYSCSPINFGISPVDSSKFLIWSLFQDSKGGIWIGTNSEGLFYMTYDKRNPKNPQFKKVEITPNNRECLFNGAIYSITEDEKGVLWISVENNGLYLFDLNEFSENRISFQHILNNPYDTDGLSDNSVHCIYRDNQNTMWIGTYGFGLNFYNVILQKFDHLKYVPGATNTIDNNRVNVIYEEDKHLWIGTEGGLNVYDKHKRQYNTYKSDPNNPNSIGSNAVWAICRDSRNNMWIGTWSGGLNLFNESTKTFRHFLPDKTNINSIGGNNIYGIIETKDNNLWIASMLGGLNRYDYSTGNFQQYLVNYNKNSISGDWVMDLMESSDGSLWISTTVAVDILDRKTGHFVSFKNNPQDPQSISYDGALVLFEDSKKNIWIGTSNGLNLFNKADSTFRYFQMSEGLPSNVIRAIEEDNNGNLWISTNNGISKFMNAINLPAKPVFVNYTTSDGLQGSEFNTRSSFKNKDGLIYFGGNNGYNVFNPSTLKTNPYIPNIVFTRLLLFNKPVGIGNKCSPLEYDISHTKELKLRRKDNVLTIEFASLNLLTPEKNQYAFKLEGFEEKWNYVGGQHAATYTNLDPGRYTFKVKASNNDGLWNEEGISLDIIIMPAWWETLYAKLFYLLCIALLVYFVRKQILNSVGLKNELWREQIEKKKTEELIQLKNQFFTNVSHELRTPLTLILGPLKRIIFDSENASALQPIYSNASKLKKLVDQIMDIGKIENNMMKLNLVSGNIVEHLLSCSKNFIELAQQKQISYHFKSSLSNCYCDFDADKTEIIFSNILSNAFKNTPAGGSVLVTIAYQRPSDILIIEFSDTGKGIDPLEIEHIFDRFYSSSKPSDEFSSTGIGLDLTKKLVELHNGSISVTSLPGNGATFTIKIPLPGCNIQNGIIEEILTKPEKVNWVEPGITVPKQFKHEKRVLVIDDNSEMCDYIESILSDSYDVIKVTNPNGTFDIILTDTPDLIISDVMMPGINGFELVKQIRNDIRFSHIPIILLTAKVTVDDHITGYEVGADDYIYKPFEGEILKARIKNLIAQQEKLRKHFIGNDGVINQKIKTNDLDVKFIDSILNLIRTHYSDPEFNVNVIIESMNMSRSIFYKKFKALSEQSVNDLIKSFRIKKAAELLNSGRYTVSEVAYECGFSDPAYFSKVFKEHYKMSPKEFTGKQ
jgi:signal transduction histidine kinase/ligand-binding sensor domain-containing protein/AraC-like DNA-binding protein